MATDVLFFSRDSEAAFGIKVEPGEARFGPELDWEKPWRDQVFGAKMSETNGNRRPFFPRDSEAAFGTQSGTRGGSFWTRIRLGKAVA